jgi:ubiquinone/menaquinone biosynthesis C-methylase UbiE
MLPRLSREQIADIIGWDINNWSRALPVWDKVLQSAPAGSALELGAREGGLSLYLAIRGRRVVCSDLANPEQPARPLHDRHGVSSLVSYEVADATRLPYSDLRFSVVAFKSLLGSVGREGGFPRQRQAMAEMRRVLQPGGLLLFAENSAATAWHRFLRRHFTSWGGSWRYPTHAEIQSLLASFSVSSLRSIGFLATLGRREWQRSWLSHLDAIVDPLLPPEARYVTYGWARR